jgi:hypothetical protein
MLLLYGTNTTMPAYNFEDKDTQYAYECIRSFFDHFVIDDAVSWLESIIKAATRKKIWKKEVPAQMLLYMRLLEELITAAFEITESCTIGENAIIANDSEEASPAHVDYVSHYRGCNSWSCFPRSLTLKQYCNPYKAIKKFTRYATLPQWKTYIKDCTEYALLDANIDDVLLSYDILAIRLRLLQLIEACHLLDVRTNANE